MVLTKFMTFHFTPYLSFSSLRMPDQSKSGQVVPFPLKNLVSLL